MLLRLVRNMFSAQPAARSRRRTSRRILQRQVEQLEPRLLLALQSWQIFPANNPWNQNISAAPLASNSAAIIANIGAGTSVHPDWGADNPANGASPLYGIPVNIVHGASTTKVNVSIDNYPTESDILPVPIPAGAVLEGDFQNGPNLNGGGYGENGNPNQRGDSHLIVFDEDNNVAYELYGVSRPNDPTLFPNNSDVEVAKNDMLWHAAQESVWDFKTNTFRTLGATSADAAGLSILAGLARPDEGLTVAQGGQGVINHALRVTLPSSVIDGQYIYPASHRVNDSAGASKLPLGARMRLANTTAVNAKINAMPPESQIVARAMQQYGLIVADIGSAMFVTGESATVDNVDSPTTKLTWNIENDILASNGLKALKASDFEVVDLTPQVTSLSATGGSTGSQITVIGKNFSGAAGNLSVYFGAVAAAPNTITLVSDSQISVRVPAGAGSVHITVQSGVQKTDTISGVSNANVTKPIWGYGKSTATAADLFNYVTPPSANADSYSVTGGATLSIAGPGVLANDSDPQGFALTATVATGPAHGTLALNSNGSFTYTPTSGYLGPDSFTYTAGDGYASSNPATGSITISAGTLTWNKNSSGVWTESQWSGMGPPFPDRTSNAILSTAQVVTVSGSQAANSLVVSGGGQIAIGAGASLAVTGATSIAAGGTLAVSPTGAFSTAGALTLDTGASITGGSVHAATFELDNGVVSANLSGTGGVTKSGSGTVTLSGHNTYAGSTTVQSGELIIVGGALPVGTSLIIGGSPGVPAIVTLAPSDANGNPLNMSTSAATNARADLPASNLPVLNKTPPSISISSSSSVPLLGTTTELGRLLVAWASHDDARKIFPPPPNKFTTSGSEPSWLGPTHSTTGPPRNFSVADGQRPASHANGSDSSKVRGHHRSVMQLIPESTSCCFAVSKSFNKSLTTIPPR